MSDPQLSPNNLEVIQRFRILVIGNANAGKTTILNEVCKGQTDLEKPTTECGKHDIENEVVYPSAHGFAFHDSRGFEAGGSDELEKVQDFIRRRSEQKELKDQLHVIWYCLSTSGDRSLTKAEMSLFESGTGNVPVVAIFTKMDAIDKKIFNKLTMIDGVPFSDAKKQVPSAAKDKFEIDFLEPLKKVRYPPAQIVQLRDMQKADKNCDDLILRTARALDKKALKLLALSTIRNGLKLHIEAAVKEVVIPHAQAALESSSFSQKEQESLLRGVIAFFPYILPSFAKNLMDMAKNAVIGAKEMVGLLRNRNFEELRLERRLLEEREFERNRNFEELRLEREFFRLERRFFDEFEFEREEFFFEERRREEEDDDFLTALLRRVQSVVPDLISLHPQTQAIILGISTIIIVEYALSVDLSTAVKAFNPAPIFSTLMTSGDMKFNCSKFTAHHGYTAILQLIDANCLAIGQFGNHCCNQQTIVLVDV